MAMWPDLSSQMGQQPKQNTATLAQVTQPYSAREYTLENPQTLDEFMSKYQSAINSDGKFIPGKANLNYDDMDAATVYKQLMGGYTIPGYTDNGQPYEGPGTAIAPAASANADWIEDPRAKGWIGQHPMGAAIAGTVLGGVGANMLGLLGGTGATGTASTAFGGPGSFTGANAVGAGDLALGSMPQVGAGTVGLPSTGGLGAIEGLGSGLSNLGAVDTGASVLTKAPAGLTEIFGTGANVGTGTLGGATNAAGQLIGNGSAAGSYTAGFASSPIGKIIGGLGGDSALSAAGGASSVLGGLGGVRDIAQGLGTIWSAGKGSENATNNQNAINGQIKSLTDMFGQDSPYAKMLRQTLERKDAAAGRNSQYGNRETQLQALLAEKALQSSGAIGNLAQQSSALDNTVNGGRNTQLNALDSILNKTGAYDWTTSWLSNGLNSMFGD